MEPGEVESRSVPAKEHEQQKANVMTAIMATIGCLEKGRIPIAELYCDVLTWVFQGISGGGDRGNQISPGEHQVLSCGSLPIKVI
jgi:hypothetical protein